MGYEQPRDNGNRVRVLVVSDTTPAVDDGPGGEVWRIAEALSRGHDVILALPEATSHTHRDFAVIYYNQRNLGLVARDSDAVICSRDVIEANGFFTAGGSVAAANMPRLRQGVIEGAGTGLGAAAAGNYYIWVPPEPKKPGGARHYLARLRLYKRQGGYRFVMKRVMAAIGRRLGFGRQP